jgi:hypothetical protein
MSIFVNASFHGPLNVQVDRAPPQIAEMYDCLPLPCLAHLRLFGCFFAAGTSPSHVIFIKIFCFDLTSSESRQAIQS